MVERAAILAAQPCISCYLNPLLCSGHLGIVVYAVHLAGGGAVYYRRLSHQLGRAGGGRADGVSTERYGSRIRQHKTAVGGVDGLFHFHSPCKIGTADFAGRNFALKAYRRG